jgi:two-component system phosphate regulon sensor histidine kinase PhoR
MQHKKTNIFIALSSIALLSLLAIQVNWILRTAKIKSDLFNEKANMVLARTAEALAADKDMCEKIEACVDTSNASGEVSEIGKNEVHKLDSLFRYYMNFYNIQIQYSFVVTKPTFLNTQNRNGFANLIYQKRVDEGISANGLDLKLIFPDRKQFIMAEMGGMFITSVILILVVLILFWRTVLALIREKRVAYQTTEFLNNMTHEFKTPLTNIGLAGKMISREMTNPNDNKVKHYAEIILMENEKLSHQVEQVLGMTALERGDISLKKSIFNMHSLIGDVLKTMSLQVEEKQGHFRFSPDAEQAEILGDNSHLSNALSNLIDNAIKYSKVNPEVTISTSNTDQQLLVTIADRGIGIDKKHHAQIFDKFFRVPTGDLHDVKGFGLGLAYAKKIIELHGGSLCLQSETGQGTTFTMTLPSVHNV